MFKIQRNLLYKATQMAIGAIEPTNDPSNPGQYLLIRATDGALGFTVARQDAVSRLIIDKVDRGMLEVTESTTVALKGDELALELAAYDAPDIMTVSLKKTVPTPLNADTEVMGLGKISFKIKGYKKDEGFSMQAVDIDVTPKLDEGGEDVVVVLARDLINGIKGVSQAVGKATHRSEFSNVQFKALDNRLYLVGLNSQQLAQSVVNRIEVGRDFSAVIPYDMVVLATKVLNPDIPVKIIYNKTTPDKVGTVVFNQDFFYPSVDDKPIGKFSFRVTCALDKFAKYDDLISKTDFEKHTVKVNTQRLQRTALKLSIEKFDPDARMDVVVNPASDGGESGIIDFHKASKNEIDTHLDVISSSKEPFDLVVSSRHLRLAADSCENEVTEIQFSGKKSLAKMICSESLTVFFMPYKE